MASGPTPPSIARVPAPWTLKGTVYAFPFFLSSKAAPSIPSNVIYDDLESSSSFAKAAPLGGLSMMQIIRYSDSPVGPYDELVLVPGSFSYTRNGEQKTALKATVLYVSQKETCYNGRINWNMPKHLAKFIFKSLPHEALEISIFPRDSTGKPRRRAFFKATYHPQRYTPTFPISTSIAKYIGYDLSLVQPPLPASTETHEPGTEQWSKVLPSISSHKTSIGWFDLGQDAESVHNTDGTDRDEEVVRLLDAVDDSGHESEEGEETNDTSEHEDASPETNHQLAKYENWFPGWGRWKIGLKMEDSILTFSVPESWNTT